MCLTRGLLPVKTHHLTDEIHTVEDWINMVQDILHMELKKMLDTMVDFHEH